MTTHDKIICATVFFVCLFASWAGLVFAGKAPADAFTAFLSTTLAGGCAAFLALLRPDKQASHEVTADSEPIKIFEPSPAPAASPAAASADSGATSSPESAGVQAAPAPKEAANA